MPEFHINQPGAPRLRLAPLIHYFDERGRECRTMDFIYKPKKKSFECKKIRWEQVTEERPCDGGEHNIDKFLQKFIYGTYSLKMYKIENTPIVAGMKFQMRTSSGMSYYDGDPKLNSRYYRLWTETYEVLEAFGDASPYPKVQLLTSVDEKVYHADDEKVGIIASESIDNLNRPEPDYTPRVLKVNANAEGNVYGATLLPVPHEV